jgi:ArsR family transcriptional regulator
MDGMPPLGDHLRLFADDTRLRILHLLAGEPLTVAELQAVLELSQSSISGHLAKLKTAGLIHDLAEGSARRYRLREDAAPRLRAAWEAVRALSHEDPPHIADRGRLEDVRAQRDGSWVDRVAGDLHRAYAPGRTWDSLCHGLIRFARFGRCVDVGAGDGALLELVAPQAEQVLCIDPNQRMVDAGVQRAKALKLGNVTWKLARGEELPLEDASQDSVLFLQSLQYVEEPGRALAEAARVLAPGGQLLVLTLVRHESAEAEAFGHRHRGFSAEQLRRWTPRLTDHRHDTLPPESKAPRFQTLVLTAAKRP